MIKDRLAAAERKTLRSVRRGDGKILKLNGRRIAAYRDQKGKGDNIDSCLHASWLHRPLELGRFHLGLPMPWFEISANRGGSHRAGGIPLGESVTRGG